MNAKSTELKLYGDKISAQLQQAKSQIEQFETRASETKAQAEIEAISALKATKKKIDKKLKDLHKSGEPNATQVIAEIETEIANFKTSLEQLGTQLTGRPKHKVRKAAAR
jgi:DNA relaxase NicK